jgi:hypothetical protein
MRLRAIVAAVLSLAAPSPLLGGELIAAPVMPPALTSSAIGDVMARFGLSGLFVRFGQSLAAGPRLQGVGDVRFLAAWEASALAAFDSPALDRTLAGQLGATLTAEDAAWLDGFMASDLGSRISALERESQEIPAGRQIATLAKGQVIYLGLSDRRRAQLAELMTLTGADITIGMMGDSLRGLALGLALSSDTGDVAVPWDEIDAAVTRKLAGMQAELSDATRGLYAYTYSSLSDEELETYLQFLRAPATKKFYATATLAIGDIVRETLFGLGETVAERLKRVSI